LFLLIYTGRFIRSHALKSIIFYKYIFFNFSLSVFFGFCFDKCTCLFERKRNPEESITTTPLFTAPTSTTTHSHPTHSFKVEQKQQQKQQQQQQQQQQH
jgi:hypothetical protein